MSWFQGGDMVMVGWHRGRLRLLLAAALLAVSGGQAAAATGAAAAAATPASWTFATSQLVGGGFVNVLAVDPFSPSVVLAGGDVSGMFRSSDSGSSWTAANTGITSATDRHIASLAFSPTTPGLVYAAVGYRGPGGLLRSTDDGLSWSVVSRVPDFSGSNNLAAGGLPTDHPRSTGNLLVLAPDGSIYAGTFSSGVLRSTDGGATWSSLGLGGQHLRSLVADPAAPDTLYAASYETGVWRLDGASTATPTLTSLTSGPSRAEELLISGGTLYVAAGTQGLFASTDQGATWSLLGSGSLPSSPGPDWTSLASVTGCAGTVLYAGSDAGGAYGIARSADGGQTWTGLGADSVRTSQNDPTIASWWLAGNAAVLPGGASFTVGQLVAVPPAAGGCSDAVLAAGRSGVWGSADGATWSPHMAGLGVTYVKSLAASSATAGRFVAGLTDWAGSTSTGAGITWTHPRTGTGYAATVDAAGTAYLGIGAQPGSPNSGGDVFSSTGLGSGAWKGTGLGKAAGGLRPRALLATTARNKPVLLAAVEGGGIWRKAAATWTHPSTACGSAKGATLLAVGTTLLCLDRDSGLWRSTDGGASWSTVWQTGPQAETTGYLAVDPRSPKGAYATVSGKLWHIADVTLPTITPVALGLTSAGPLATGADGALVVAQQPTATVAAGLLVSTDGGSTFADRSTGSYRATVGTVNALALAADGSLAVALDGSGLLLGTPAAP